MSIPRSIRVILLSLTTLLLLWNCQIDMSPVARDDTAATDRNVPVTITVVTNDTAGTGHIVASTVAVVAGPEHGTARAQADGTVIYSPATDFVGTDSFSYVVADITGETSNTAMVTVTVRAVNRAPVANAGPDINAVMGQPVILDGAQSFDPDRDPLSFAWQFVAVPATSSVTTASLANAQTAAPSFTPDVDGTYGLELTVSDGTLSSTDQVQVTAVSRPNVPPNANAGQDQTAQVGTVVLLDGRGSQDPDNGPQPLTFQWSFVAVPSESILTTADLQGATTPLANFTPDVVGVYRVSLQVSDGRNTSQAEVQITAAPPNVEPNADAGLPMVVQLGTAATLNGTASHDPDNGPQPLTYQWTLVSKPAASGLTNASIQDATTATPSFTPDVAGIYVLRLDVSDGALSDFAQVLVKANAAPVAADDTFDAKQDQPLTVPAPGVLSNDTDGNNDPLTVVLGNTVSHGALTLNADGSFTYTPTTGFLGTDSFTYQANDGSVDSNIAAVTVTVSQGKSTAITLTPNPLTLTPSTTGSVTVALTRPAGPAGQVVTLLSSNSAVASVPPSVTIPANASSTTVTVTAGTTPGAATISASAPGLTEGSTTVTVSQGISAAITLTPNPLTLTPSTTASVTVALTRPAGPAGQVVTLLSSNSAVASVPPSVTIPANASSTTVTVTAGTTPGATTISASAPGLTGGSTTVNVRCPTLTVTPPGVTTGIINVPFSQSFSQSGALGTATFTVASGTLPTGLTLASSGLLAGTPTQTGSFPITVRVTDTNGCTGTSATYPLSIGQVPALTSANATTFTVGAVGMFTITATGSPAPTFAAAGTLPAGVTLNSTTGVLAGTPAPGTAGIYPFTITASNGIGSPAMQLFTLTVLCVPITVNPVGPALAEGTFGVAYSQTFTASGGTAPHSFTAPPEAIPAGLTLASGGGLTGSPTNTGNFSFTVTATDVNLCTGSTAYTLLVRPNAQPEIFANGVGNTQYVVGLAAPATPAVMVAGSVLGNDAGSGALNAGPASITTSANGSVAMNPNGTFTYTPAVGFAGPSDTFTYTLTDGNGMTNTAVVTINLSEVVWYVDNTYAGTNGPSDGRSHRPFTTLDAAETPSLANQYIFVHQGINDTSGGIVLDSGQTLWGQGTPFTLNGLTVAATGKPTVTGTIMLASNVTVSSLDVNTESSPGITDPNDPPGPASAITGVIITNAVAITTTSGTAVSLSDTSGTLAFERISADGAVNGISLTNTAGSFTVTGDGVSARNDTGGTITNMTGDSIRLTNVENASFSRMNITDNGDNGIFGTDVNGFVVDWCSFSSNGSGSGKGAIQFGDEFNNNINGLVGSDPAGSNPTRITNSLFSRSSFGTVTIFNTSGTLTELDVTNSIFAMPSEGPGFLIATRGKAVATVIVTGSTFQGALPGLQGSALAQSNLTLKILGATNINTFVDNFSEGVRCSSQDDADMRCEVSDNTFTGNLRNAIFVGNGTTLTDRARLNGKILANIVTMPSGSTDHTILSSLSGSGSSSALLISSNTVTNNGLLNGIHVDTPGVVGTRPNFSVTVTNNNVTTAATGINAISLNAERNATACFNVLSNMTAAPGIGVLVRQRNPSAVILERGTSASNMASVVLAANNLGATGGGPLSGTMVDGTVTAVNNGTCATPP